MSYEPYKSLINGTKPILSSDDWAIYDLTSECCSYIYVEGTKYTFINGSDVEECMKDLLDYLAKEHGASEFSNCFEACKQPSKNFFVATALLLLIKKKIKWSQSDEKAYLELIDKNKPIARQAPSYELISVLNEKYAKLLKDNEESVQNEYRSYRDTYGR